MFFIGSLQKKLRGHHEKIYPNPPSRGTVIIVLLIL